MFSLLKVSCALLVLAQSSFAFHAPTFGVVGRKDASSTSLSAMVAQSVDLAEASSSKLREAPLDMYRNIGIMAHIDAGERK